MLYYYRCKLRCLSDIFISHSQRDAELVKNIKGMLENIGHTPIIEEFIPEENKVPIPYEEIRLNVVRSDFVFLLLTDNIVNTQYTRNWVIYEDGIAAQARKRVFVFERQGEPVPYPIPYVTDYALFDHSRTEDMLKVQALAKSLGKFRKDLITAGAGALVGSAFGPAGIIIGAILGYAVGPRSKPPPTAKCSYCNVSFNYHTTDVKIFNCPCCRKPMSFG